MPNPALLVSTGGLTALEDAILALNPVSYYKMRETTGTNMEDFGSLSNDGTYTVSSSGVTLNTVAGADGFNYPKKTQNNPAGAIVPDNSGYSRGGSGLTVMGMLWHDPGGTAQRAWLNKDNEWAIASGAFSGVNDLEALTKTSSDGTARLAYTNGLSPYNVSDWNLVIVRFSSSSSAYPNARINGSAASLTNTATNTAGGDSATSVDFGFGVGSTGLICGMGHIAFFTGQLSDADCITIEDAATAEGWYL